MFQALFNYDDARFVTFKQDCYDLVYLIIE